jgi:phenylacetate-CoA ligase
MSISTTLRGLQALFSPRPTVREQVISYQERCLRHLIRHAYQHVPYYRRLFDDAGLSPSDIQCLNNLADIPLTSRSTIQSLEPTEICAAGSHIPSLRWIKTSGSTGAPLTVRRTMTEERILLALRARACAAFGLGLRTRRVQLDYFNGQVRHADSKTKLYERLGLLPRLMIDWDTPKEEVVSAIERFRPHIISGTPSVLSWLAQELTEQDRRRMHPQILITGAETLTPIMREQIERGFGVPAVNCYGAHEVVFIAMQQPDQDDLTVCEESVIFEVLKDGRPTKPGERGEVVVTALHSFTMPFIRYRLGDQVILGDTPGRNNGPYTTIRSIEGRVIDFFILPNGRTVHPYDFNSEIKACGVDVRRFQIVQERRDFFRIHLVLGPAPAHDLEGLLHRIRRCLGPDITAQIEEAQTLPPSRSGKFYPYVTLERWNAWQSRDHSETSRLHKAKAEKMSQVFGLKFKIRNPKSETIPKDKCSKSKTIKDAG